MEQIEIIHILLVLIILSLIAIFIRLSYFYTQMMNYRRVDNECNDDHHRQQGELLQTQNDIFVELSSDIKKLKSAVEDMKYISDIFYKYKLPNIKEREILDQITIDDEVSDGIVRSSERTT